RNPQGEITYVQPADREKAPLLQRGQAGNALFFGFPETSDPDALINDGIETLSERAVKELCDFLPINGSDDGALDAVLLQRDTIRNAVSDIVSAVTKTSSLGLTLTPTSGDEVTRSMTTEQARVLGNSLRESREDVGYETVTGRLDGVRTRRRIFYLERDTGSTIQGAVVPDLLDQIKVNLDRPVTARLRVVRTTTTDGRRGRPVYELLDIHGESSLFDRVLLCRVLHYRVLYYGSSGPPGLLGHGRRTIRPIRAFSRHVGKSGGRRGGAGTPHGAAHRIRSRAISPDLMARGRTPRTV